MSAWCPRSPITVQVGESYFKVLNLDLEMICFLASDCWKCFTILTLAAQSWQSPVLALYLSCTAVVRLLDRWGGMEEWVETNVAEDYAKFYNYGEGP